MSNFIKIRKGLDIPLFGKPTGEVIELKTDSCALKPLDCTGITPKLMVEEGDKVDIGTPIYYSKQNPLIKFCSPISGQVAKIQRGEKRRIEQIIIKNDNLYTSLPFNDGPISLVETSKDQIKELLLQSGLWTLLRQRPYSVIASEQDSPKYIIIKGFDSSPLAMDYNIAAKGNKAAMQIAIDALIKLTDKKIYLSINKDTKAEDILSLKNVNFVPLQGKHPYGNVSVISANISPLNKKERLWYIDLQDLITIGNLFLTGKYCSEKIIALCGQEVLQPGYYRVRRGTNIYPMIENNVNPNEELRYISGNILTGEKIDAQGFLSYYDNQITVIREGHYQEGFGWLLPGLKKFSFSRTFLKGFFVNCSTKPVNVDTNLHGGQRAYIFTGDFEKVMPLDIYPMQLIKAALANDIDKMEALGIYEVDSEDFALCEVIDISKTDIQQIISQGLETMRKEGL